MPYARNSALPAGVQNALPAHAQTIWRNAFNSAEAQYGTDDEARLARIAWGAVKNAGYEKNPETGRWSRTGEHSMKLIDGGWLAVFRTGQHTDMHGFTRQWSGEDLASIVRNYASKEHEAPLVIGHPRLDDPAYGWCKDVRANGSLLEVQVHQIVPQFAALVEQGSYKKRSIALDGDGQGGWRLRHVGFLGATPPAVAGLPDLVRPFASQPVGTHIFATADLEVPPASRLRRALRSLTEALQHLGEPEPEEAEEAEATEPDKVTTPPEESSTEETDPMPETQAATSTAMAQAVQQAEERMRQEFATQREADALRIAALEADNRRQAITARLHDLKRQGRVTPAMEKLGLLAFCERLAATPETTLTFAAAGGAETTQPLAQWFDAFLAALPQAVTFGTLVDPLDETGRTTQPTPALLARAQSRAHEQQITVGAALAALGQEDPLAYRAYVEDQRRNGRN